jgi:tetratricopeptide (TPR) repeat protein
LDLEARVRFWLLLLSLIVFLLAATGLLQMEEALWRNRQSYDLAHRWLEGEGREATLEGLEERAHLPYAAYFLGLKSFRQGDLAQAEGYASQALGGGVRYLSSAQVLAPTSRELAETATRLYPGQAMSWKWWGDLIVDQSPHQALEAYMRAVELTPWDNLAWEKVGGVAAKLGEHALAFDALGRACSYNRARSGYCAQAARLAFQLGDWENVILYYQLGNYPRWEKDWAKMIRAAQHLGRTEEAHRYLEQAQRETPADYQELLEKLP